MPSWSTYFRCQVPSRSSTPPAPPQPPTPAATKAPTDGYYHLGARYYDTQSHFTQADLVAGSLNQPEKYNSYTYTAGDPINNSDLNGESFFSAVGQFFGDVGTFAGAGAGIGAPLGFLSAESLERPPAVR